VTEFYQGRESLKRLADSDVPEHRSYLLNQLYPRTKQMKFDKHWIRLGFRHFPSSRYYELGRNELMLNVREVFRALVLGETGSGKTMTLRALATRFYFSGHAVILLTDIKDEMKSSAEPAPPSLARLLPADEFAQGLPMKVFRPLFYLRFFGDPLPSRNERFAFCYRDMHFTDLLRALGFVGDRYRNQYNALSDIYQDAGSLEELRQLVITKITNTGIRDSIIRALDPLVRFQAFPAEPVGDVVQALLDGHVVVFNHHKYDRVGIGTATLPQLYVTIAQRKIVEALEQKRLRKRVVAILDEAPKFVGKEGISQEEILKAIDTYRYLGFNMIFAAQTKDQLPPSVAMQCKYIFLPFNMNPETAKAMLAQKQFYDFHPSFTKKVADMFRRMKKHHSGVRQWMLIDSDRKELDIFWAYPSLSAHQHELAA
jgi:hypothetical protein